MPARMATINKSTNKCWQGWRKGNPHALLVGLQIGVATMENSMEFPQKIESRTTVFPSNSTSGYLSKEIKNTNLKNICTTMIVAALCIVQ